MKKRYDFNLTPAYCLYNGAAVLEQDGASIRFLVENKKDKVLCGRLSRAFENHVENIRRLKDCPEAFQRLIKIEFESGSRGQLRSCVSRLYLAGEGGSGGVAGAGSGCGAGGFGSKVGGSGGGVAGASEKAVDSKSKNDAAAVLLLDNILNEARQRKATDIHIEKNCVRLRVDGRLEMLLELQSDKSGELIQRIKLLSGMNVIENRRCQDGHFIYGNKNPFFLRVSTMSVMGTADEGHYSGEESVVIRLLDTTRIPLCLGELGFNKLQLEKICEIAFSCPNGLVLVCGPTGSGKSTTIASLLIEIEKQNGGGLKIISLEDPPEYVIPGITQVKIDERNGFSDALNHIFRQDPDVIMIGEIRDEESAAAALRASLTGHLVFATLHAGSSSESILRLENLGLDRALLCQVLRGIICQELNVLNGKLRLYADLAIPKENFVEKACLGTNINQLEELLDHFTNYGEVLDETMQGLLNRKKRVTRPFYKMPDKRRSENAGIHKGAV